MGISTTVLERVLERLAALRANLAAARRSRQPKRQPDIRVMFFPPSPSRDGEVPFAGRRSTGRIAITLQPRARAWPGRRPDGSPRGTLDSA